MSMLRSSVEPNVQKMIIAWSRPGGADRCRSAPRALSDEPCLLESAQPTHWPVPSSMASEMKPARLRRAEPVASCYTARSCCWLLKSSRKAEIAADVSSLLAAERRSG